MWTCPQCGRRLPIDKWHADRGVKCVCRRAVASTDPITPIGPGSELAKLFKSLGFKPQKECGCAALRRDMDDLGPDGCRREFDRLVDDLRGKYQQTTATERIKAGAAALFTGLAFKLDWSDPIPSLLHLAIQRAEKAS